MSQKLPALQFYPGDWRKDVGVQSLDFFDRGVWFEVMCLMHESEDRGRLILNGRPMPDHAIARVLGLSVDRWLEVRTRLVDFGVASEDENGVLVNRRMVRDEEVRRQRAKAGQKGGKRKKARKSEANPKQNPKQTEPDNVATDSDLGGVPPSKPEAKAKQTLPPSVSSSTSTSVSTPPPNVGGELISALCATLDDGCREAVEGLYAEQRKPDVWAKGVVSLWVGTADSEPTEPLAAKVDRPTRLRALGLGLSRYRAEGERWNGRYFRGFMEKAIKEVADGRSRHSANGRAAKEGVRGGEGIGANQGDFTFEGDEAA